jgi:hypothetical protein
MNKLPDFVSQVVDAYTSRLIALLPSRVEGIYLTGSTALGDYYSKKSDIDFLTLLKEAPSTTMLKKIGDIHHDIETTYHHPKLNGYYLTMNGIKTRQASFPSFFKNKMYFDKPFELDRLTLYEWETSSYHIQGTPVENLNINVEVKDVLIQLHENVNSYWTSWIQKHSSFGYKALLLMLFPRLSEWGILGVARQLYTLNTGKITSKLNAGIEFLENLPAELKEVMMTAIQTRRTNKTQLRFSIKRVKETRDCMQYLISKFNKTYYENVGSSKT